MSGTRKEEGPTEPFCDEIRSNIFSESDLQSGFFGRFFENIGHRLLGALPPDPRRGHPGPRF